MRQKAGSLPAWERAGWFVLPQPRVLAARKWRVSSREKFTKGRGRAGLGKNTQTEVTVLAWNFRALAWVLEGLFQPESSELSAQLLFRRDSCPRPQLLGVLHLLRATRPLRGTKNPGKSVVIWSCKVPGAWTPVSLLVLFAHCCPSLQSEPVPAS